MAMFGDLHYSALPAVQKRFMLLDKVGFHGLGGGVGWGF
jgi:hypothetical protein